jgi:multiple antibiotic resistance protein
MGATPRGTDIASNTSKLISYLRESKKNIINKISAFLVFCVGMDIGFTGLMGLIKAFSK